MGGWKTQDWASAAWVLFRPLDQGPWDAGWGLEWREGLNIKNNQGGRASGGAGGLSVGGPLMGNGLPGRRGQSSLRSGLWQCGTSGRARGLPGGNSRCRLPRWTAPSHSPGWEENTWVGKAPVPPPHPLVGIRKTKCFLAQSWYPHRLCPAPSYTHPNSALLPLSSPRPPVQGWAAGRAAPTPIKNMGPVPLVSTPF